MIFDGEDVSDALGHRAAARRTGAGSQLIFQDPYETLDPKQTICDFVAEPLVVNGLGGLGEGPARGA